MDNIRPSYNENRQVLGEVLPLDTPFTVILDASERCNFKCNYCFRSTPASDSWGYAKDNELMTMEVFEHAARQLLDFPSQIRRISLSNHGEPLCNKNLPSMIRYIKNIGLSGKTEIHTNAALLNADSAVELAHSNIDRIIVSIQGISSEAYQKVCGASIDFERFCKNLQLLYQHKSESCQINIKTVDTALNGKDDEDRFYHMFSGFADRVFVERVVPLFNQVEYVDNKSNDMYNKYGRTFQYIDCCPQMFYTLCVSPSGDIFPCAQIPPPLCLGNIKDITLAEAWSSKTRIDFLMKHLRETRKSVERCAGCYIPQNSVKTEQDILDNYRDAILERIGQ